MRCSWSGGENSWGTGVVGRHRGAFGVRGQVSIRLQVRLRDMRLGTGHIIGVWGQVTSLRFRGQVNIRLREI